MENSKFYQLTEAALNKKGDLLLEETNSLYLGELLERFKDRLPDINAIKGFASAIVKVSLFQPQALVNIENYGNQLSMFPKRLLEAAADDAYIHVLAQMYAKSQEVEEGNKLDLEVSDGLVEQELLFLISTFDGLVTRNTLVKLLKQLHPNKFSEEMYRQFAEIYDLYRFKKSEIGPIQDLLVHSWRLSRNELNERELQGYATKLHLSYFETLHTYYYLFRYANCSKYTTPGLERVTNFLTQQYYYYEGEKKITYSNVRSLDLDRVVPSKRALLLSDTDNLRNLSDYRLTSLATLDLFNMCDIDKEYCISSIPNRNDLFKKLSNNDLQTVEDLRIKQDSAFKFDNLYFYTLFKRGIYSEDNPRKLIDAKIPYKYLVTHVYASDILFLLDVLSPEEKNQVFRNIYNIEKYQYLEEAKNQRLVLIYIENYAYYSPSQFTKKLIEVYKSEITGLDKNAIKSVLQHMVSVGKTTMTDELAEIVMSTIDKMVRNLESEVKRTWRLNMRSVSEMVDEYAEYLTDNRIESLLTNAFCKATKGELNAGYTLLQKLKQLPFQENSIALMSAALEKEVINEYDDQDSAFLKFIINSLDKSEKESA